MNLCAAGFSRLRKDGDEVVSLIVGMGADVWARWGNEIEPKLVIKSKVNQRRQQQQWHHSAPLLGDNPADLDQFVCPVRQINRELSLLKPA